jgi:hypothetical protein
MKQVSGSPLNTQPAIHRPCDDLGRKRPKFGGIRDSAKAEAGLARDSSPHSPMMDDPGYRRYPRNSLLFAIAFGSRKGTARARARAFVLSLMLI